MGHFETVTNGPGNDKIYSGFGNDTIYGGKGDDTISGGGGNDHIYGEYTSIDTLEEGSGADTIDGGTGSDTIWAGAGDDTIRGGLDKDFMFGGGGADKFVVKLGDTGITHAKMDWIYDFNAKYDSIEVSRTSGGWYHERYFFTASTDSWETRIDAARGAAAQLMNEKVAGNNFKGNDYAFVSDHKDGFLFADLNNDGYMDTGIVLVGLTSLDQFSVADILNAK